MAETITVHAEPIDVDTPFGRALCIAWYDYGYWTETQFMCVVMGSGKIVFVPHQDIRYVNHYSARITSSKPPEAPSYMAKVKPIPMEGEVVTSVDKFSDVENGERWARKHGDFHHSDFHGDFGEPMHLPEEDGA